MLFEVSEKHKIIQEMQHWHTIFLSIYQSSLPRIELRTKAFYLPYQLLSFSCHYLRLGFKKRMKEKEGKWNYPRSMHLTLNHFFWLSTKGQEIFPLAKDCSEPNTGVLISCPVRKENIKLYAMTLCCFRQIHKFCFLDCISNSS